MTKSLEPDRVERLRKKLYEKAKREPEFRFYSLYDKVCWLETLQRSYAAAKAKGGAAGVDGVRFEDIESSGRERWLGELREELLEERYTPQAVRRVKIPKPGGGERPLGIPTIRDRVVQGAVVLFLGPIFEADFEDNVYGYRPERSAHDALREVRERMNDGQYHVVDADIVRYFEEIPHGDLLKSVARRIADGKVLRLVKLWLKSPVEERERSGRWRRTGGRKQKRGIPQGGVISPLLANVYINRVLRHWRETGMSQRLGGIVSYADDFVILCRSHRQARRSLEVITAWLAKVGLTIHPGKTRVCDVWEESFDFLGYTFGTRRRFPTGTRFLGTVPSKKALRRLKDRVNTMLYRGNPSPWPQLRGELNRLLAGWANYFSFGWTGQADTAIHWHVAQKARRFLRKRHKLPRGSGRFGLVEVYGPKVGILDIWRYRKRAASRMPSGEASP